MLPEDLYPIKPIKKGKKAAKGNLGATRLTIDDTPASTGMSSPTPTALQTGVDLSTVDVAAKAPVEKAETPVVELGPKRNLLGRNKTKKGANGLASNDRPSPSPLDTSEKVVLPKAPEPEFTGGDAENKLDGIWTSSPRLKGSVPTLEPTLSKLANPYVRVLFADMCLAY